jgi:hypothetical protein
MLTICLADFDWGDSLQKVLVSLVVLVASAIGSFVLGRWWGRRRAWRKWHKKDFLDRLNISLNQIHNSKLRIRTLMERSLEQVFQNAAAVEMVREAAEKTTVEDPMLPIPPHDRWYLLNFVLNAVAEQFTAGLVRRDAGEPVRVVRYAICLTCEKVGDERVHKVRAMLIREELLREFPYRESMPELENHWHDTRVHTLRKMADLFAKQPDYFLTLELCV